MVSRDTSWARFIEIHDCRSAFWGSRWRDWRISSRTRRKTWRCWLAVAFSCRRSSVDSSRNRRSLVSDRQAGWCALAHRITTHVARESNEPRQGDFERTTWDVGIAGVEATDSLDGDVSIFPHGDCGVWIHVLVTVRISLYAPHNEQST